MADGGGGDDGQDDGDGDHHDGAGGGRVMARMTRRMRTILMTERMGMMRMRRW